MSELLEFLSVPQFWEQPLIAVVLISVLVILLFSLRGERNANQKEREATAAERQRHEQYMTDMVLRGDEERRFLIARFDELVVQGNEAQEQVGQALRDVAAGVATVAEATATQMAKHDDAVSARDAALLQAVQAVLEAVQAALQSRDKSGLAGGGE